MEHVTYVYVFLSDPNDASSRRDRGMVRSV
jgi:hypothetical protein